MKLIAVGKLKKGPECDLFLRYQKRLHPQLEVIEVSQAKGSSLEQKRREAEALLGNCPSNSYVIALDEGGKSFSSISFSESMKNFAETGREICFLIGGAEGLDSSVTNRADQIISFGIMTWPHMLVRVLLAEQLFRAQSIQRNHPYHRTGRPDL